MKFLTLVDIDLKKIFPILIVTFTIMTGLSARMFYKAIDGILVDIHGSLAQGTTAAQIVATEGQFTLSQMIDLGYQRHYVLFGFMFLFLVALLSFYIWYKEWFGQSKRIYMLLTLRMPRFRHILSKLTVLLIGVIIFYGMIMLNLLIGDIMMRMMMPDGLVASNNVRDVLASAQFVGLGFSVPMSALHLIYHLLFATVGFSVITVWIMLDRSKRVLGFIAGLIYAIGAATVWIRILDMFLFYDERIFVDWGFVLIVNVLSLAISWWLINKKVTI